MAFPGPMELLVIAAIVFLTLGLPAIIVVLVIFLVKSSKSSGDGQQHH